MKPYQHRAASRLAALPLGIACVLAMGTTMAQEAPADDAQTLDRINVTGSRLKRADLEGAVPLTVIDRAAIDASGDISVADVLRDTTFASFGNFRPHSGSTAQSVADVNLRGIGSERTLVLVNGRRAPYAPSTGLAADLNTIPMAAVERIEILSDGASALYGSDAIGGVVNVILRRDFDGAEVRFGKGTTAVKGGDTEETSLVLGASSERGSMLLGASYNAREILFTRDQHGGTPRGASPYGNNYYLESDTEPGAEGEYGGALPGYACNDTNFWMNDDTCAYDYNAVQADDASIRNRAVFARGSYEAAEDWTLYTAISYSHSSSFGRYAPTPGVLYVEEGTPNDPVKGDGLGAFIYHRFAAAGPRDGYVDNRVLDVNVGATWRASDRLEVDLGMRRSNARFNEVGTGYIVTPLAEAAAADGRYNLADPFADLDVVKGFTTNTTRTGRFDVSEVYANATLDLFDMAGGISAIAFGAEYREEDYADLFDSLQEAGAVAGSAGNSAAGRRDVQAAYAEWLFPMADGFDFTLAARYDRYSDYGSDVSPKVSLRWQPLANLTVRASAGEGFRAPGLPYIHSKRAFSAEQVADYRTCLAVGYSPADCGGDANNDGIADGPENADKVSYQVDTYTAGNPDLKSEHSRQYSLGLAWDATDWLNFTLDYYRIRIRDRIRQIEFSELVNFDNNGVPLPQGTSLTRRANGSIAEIVSAFANEGELDTSGLDLNMRMRFSTGMGRFDHWLQVAQILEYRVTDGDTVKDRLGWITQPELRASLRNTWSRDAFSVSWNVNLIGPQQNPMTRPVYGFIAGGEGERIGSFVTHDLAASWKALWQGTITLGVTNAGDRYPEKIPYDNRPWNFRLYDGYGRTVYLRYAQGF